MLQPQITIYDIAYILTLATFALTIVVAYYLGKRNGYIEGCKIRHKVEHDFRRGNVRSMGNLYDYNHYNERVEYDICLNRINKRRIHGTARRRCVRMGRGH